GEAVFDAPKPEVLGRNEAAPTDAMYTIPFLLWNSPGWTSRDFAPALARSFSSASLVHTWADLAGLEFAGHDRSRSLVSTEFKARPILVGNPQQPQQLIDFSLVRPGAGGSGLARQEPRAAGAQPL